MWANNKDICRLYQCNSSVPTQNQSVNATRQNKFTALCQYGADNLKHRKEEKTKNSGGCIDCVAPRPGRHLEAVRAETHRLWTTLLNSRQALTRWKERHQKKDRHGETESHRK